jgi:penicillin-binding protein 2
MSSSARSRARVLTVIGVVALTSLAAQLGNMTLRQQVAYANQATEQQTRQLPEPAPRGTIFDRNLLPLATNRPAYSVYLSYPYQNRTDVLQTLSTILNVPGVDVQIEPVREYPQGALAAHVLGYVRDSGQTGLEARYETLLAGTPGMRRVEVNNLFEPVAALDSTPPKPGMDLVLTVDATLQHTAERALDWRCTGCTLALASRPSFDPNLFVGGIAEADWALPGR